MSPLMIHLLKANIVLSVCFAFYWIFLRKLSFFRTNRIFFAACLLLSFTLPLLRLPGNHVNNNALPGEVMRMISGTLSLQPAAAPATPTGTSIGWIEIIFLLGMMGATVRLFIGLVRLARIVTTAEFWCRSEGVNVYRFHAVQSGPFSFGRSIYMDRADYSAEAWAHIRAHEAVHARQWHTADIILYELATVVCWFNPLAWLYRAAARQNLEYLADRAALQQPLNLQAYQFNLLRMTLGRQLTLLATQWGAGPLKTRLMMMNRNSRSHMLKRSFYLLLLPLMLLCIYAFHAKEKVLPTLVQAPPIIKLHSTQQTFSTHTEKPIASAEKKKITPSKQQANETTETTSPSREEMSAPDNDRWRAQVQGDDDDPVGVTVNISHEGEAVVRGLNARVLLRRINSISLPSYPDAVLLLDGKEYPLSRYTDLIDPDKVKLNQVYMGHYTAAIPGHGQAGAIVTVTFE